MARLPADHNVSAKYNKDPILHQYRYRIRQPLSVRWLNWKSVDCPALVVVHKGCVSVIIICRPASSSLCSRLILLILIAAASSYD